MWPAIAGADGEYGHGGKRRERRRQKHQDAAAEGADNLEVAPVLSAIA